MMLSLNSFAQKMENIFAHKSKKKHSKTAINYKKKWEIFGIFADSKKMRV